MLSILLIDLLNWSI